MKTVNKVNMVEVRRAPGRPGCGFLSAGGVVFVCALGRGGTTALKREGDGATPIGILRPVEGYFRAERSMIARPRAARLTMKQARASLGWCDAPGDPNYNRPVKLPYAGRHERMVREDCLYDICIVLDWNTRPVRRGCGSAIFLHIARSGWSPTEGCIALHPRDMARLLPLIHRRTKIRVHR